jgi:hypothetical protein
VGAIDSTHVPANVSVEIQEKFRDLKKGTIQNVLAAITSFFNPEGCSSTSQA